MNELGRNFPGWFNTDVKGWWNFKLDWMYERPLSGTYLLSSRMRETVLYYVLKYEIKP